MNKIASILIALVLSLGVTAPATAGGQRAPLNKNPTTRPALDAAVNTVKSQHAGVTDAGIRNKKISGRQHKWRGLFTVGLVGKVGPKNWYIWIEDGNLWVDRKGLVHYFLAPENGFYHDGYATRGDAILAVKDPGGGGDF